MLYPKIEDCIAAVECKYTLATIVFKRAKELTMKRPAEFLNSREKEISYAMKEVLSGAIKTSTTGS